jgi:hypothetical protein
VSSVDKMEVEVEVKEERLAAATPRVMPYPISEEEKTDGWNTLINQCWLQCVTCERWRNVPKVVHDEVSCLHAAHPSLLRARCVTGMG